MTTDALTIPEAAAKAGLSSTQIRNLFEMGRIRRVRLAHGQIPLISEGSLYSWVEREAGGYAQLAADLRADRRDEARERKASIAKARVDARKLSDELTQAALERSEDVLRRVRQRDYSRRLAKARANGLEAQFRASERAKFERKKANREQAVERARISTRSPQPPLTLAAET